MYDDFEFFEPFWIVQLTIPTLPVLANGFELVVIGEVQDAQGTLQTWG